MARACVSAPGCCGNADPFRVLLATLAGHRPDRPLLLFSCCEEEFPRIHVFVVMLFWSMRTRSGRPCNRGDELLCIKRVFWVSHLELHFPATMGCASRWLLRCVRGVWLCAWGGGGFRHTDPSCTNAVVLSVCMCVALQSCAALAFRRQERTAPSHTARFSW